MSSKRGLNAIVVSVIMILLVLAGTALIWSTLKGDIENASENSNTDRLTTSLNYVEDSIINQGCNFNFSVKREAGKGDIEKVRIVIQKKDLTQKTYDFPQNGSFSFKELEIKELTFSDCSLNKDDITSLTVYPIFKNEVIGLPSSGGKISTVSNPNQSIVPQGFDFNESSYLPKGSRLVGIEVTNGVNSNGSNMTYDQSFDIAKNFGTDFASLSLSWGIYLEPTQGNYDPYGMLTITDTYYPAKGSALGLVLAPPIDTNANTLPSYLSNREFNDSVVVQAYKNLTNYSLSRLSHVNITYLAIGNEIDVYLGNNLTKWDNYIDFYNKTSAFVKQNYPNIKVGSKATQNAFMQEPQKSKMQKISDSSDIILVTYYLIDSNFVAQDPQRVFTDFDYLDSLYTKPIYIAEAGYSSSSVSNSSEEKQATFYKNVMQAWDNHTSGIKLINFLWLHDRSVSEVEDFKVQYGISSNIFAEHIRTLGIINNTGTDKMSAQFLRGALDRRGW